jgi:hypothetical protein
MNFYDFNSLLGVDEVVYVKQVRPPVCLAIVGLIDHEGPEGSGPDVNGQS